MNKYVLMLAAAGLIAAAPAYYAFQAQANEAPVVSGEVVAPAPEDASAEAPVTTEDTAPEAAEPAAGETSKNVSSEGTNE